MLFETQRLSARRITDADLAAMLAVYGDAETVRFVGDAQPLTEEGCRYWVELTDRNFEKRGYGMVALTLKETGEVIGFAGIVHPGQQEEPELKYAFRRDEWGRGYATEAATGLVSCARNNWGVGRIIATVFPENNDSQRVLRKIGFVPLKDETNDDGSITQVWEMALAG